MASTAITTGPSQHEMLGVYLNDHLAGATAEMLTMPCHAVLVGAGDCNLTCGSAAGPVIAVLLTLTFLLLVPLTC